MVGYSFFQHQTALKEGPRRKYHGRNEEEIRRCEEETRRRPRHRRGRNPQPQGQGGQGQQEEEGRRRWRRRWWRWWWQHHDLHQVQEGPRSAARSAGAPGPGSPDHRHRGPDVRRRQGREGSILRRQGDGQGQEVRRRRRRRTVEGQEGGQGRRSQRRDPGEEGGQNRSRGQGGQGGSREGQEDVRRKPGQDVRTPQVPQGHEGLLRGPRQGQEAQEGSEEGAGRHPSTETSPPQASGPHLPPQRRTGQAQGAGQRQHHPGGREHPTPAAPQALRSTTGQEAWPQRRPRRLPEGSRQALPGLGEGHAEPAEQEPVAPPGHPPSIPENRPT